MTSFGMTPRVGTALLICEDVHPRDGLRGILQGAGFQVFILEESQEALTFCQSVAVDLVFIDVDLPNGEGFSTIVRFARELPRIKIIACLKVQYYSQFEPKKVAERLGARGILFQPYEASAVLEVIHQVLAS